jgi:electron transfer flavoprotein beta subunit
MAARTKPLQVLDAQTSTIGSLTQSFELPAPKGACKMIDASNAGDLIRILNEEAKVI